MNGVAVGNSQSPSAVAADTPATGAGSTINEQSPRQESTTTTPSDPTQTGVTDPPHLESAPTSTLHLALTGSEERREQNDTPSAVATIGDKDMVSGGENGRQAELELVVKEEGEVTLEHANDQIELLEHASDTIVGVGEAGVVTEDGHEWLAEGDHELKRVKVYELIGSRWMDQGTAFCFGQFQEDTNEALLIARSERNYHDIILSTAIRSNDVYQRQQETLIVWTEPDGVDYALSFQDPEGCSEVWNFILEVQRHMNNDDGSPDPSLTMASIIRSGSLPRPQLGIIGEIEKAIKTLSRTPHLKERICEYIQTEGYIKSLIEVMNTAEDLESLENLHALCSLMQTILMLNDHGMYEHILGDDIFFGVVGMLEYDPDFPAHKANYRQFLHQTSQFHQPIPLRDIAIQRKIHHTYRLQFLKDVVLARALDDSTFNVLNSCIIFNQIDIIQHVQQDHAFLREVVRLFVDEEMLTGAPPKKTPALGPYSHPSGSQQPPQPQHMVISLNGNGDNLEKEAVSMDVDQKPANGVLPTQNGRTATKRSASYAFSPPDDLKEHDISLRREVILLIQQLCIMGKNVQLPARLTLFRTLVDRGILFATQWALGLPDKAQENKSMVSAGGEVLSALIDHDLNGVRTHVLKQEMAIEKERLAGKKGADKAETLLELVCKIVTQCRDLAIQSQVGDALKAWLDVPPDSPPMAASEAGPPKPPIRKDEPGTERFMDYFYKGCVHILFKPLNELVEWRNVKGHVLPLSREETNRFVYLCDLLYNCISQHHFRSHFYIMSSNIMSRVASLLKAKDKHLRHASFRIFRQLLKQNNSNSHAQMMKHDVLKPILDLTLQESRRDNLLSCSCQEYFDSMRKENMKDMIKFCMTKHEEEVRKLAATPLGGQRFDLFIRRWEMNNEPPPSEEPKSDKPIDARSWPGQGRHALDAEEEDYFNNDDDEEEISIPIMEPWSRGTGVSSPLPMNIGLKRKRRPAVGTGPKGHRPPLRTPILGSLVDYDDEEDTNQDESSSKLVPPQRSSSQPPSPGNPPPSPKLAHRQVPSSGPPPPTRNAKDEDEEDNLLEALVRPRARSQSPSPPAMTMVPLKPLEKRRRNDDDDDELLDRLRKSKKPDLGSLKQGAVVAGRTKNGDDPPRKIKVKFGAASFVVASTSSPTTTTDIDVKDADTG